MEGTVRNCANTAATMTLDYLDCTCNRKRQDCTELYKHYCYHDFELSTQNMQQKEMDRTVRNCSNTTVVMILNCVDNLCSRKRWIGLYGIAQTQLLP